MSPVGRPATPVRPNLRAQVSLIAAIGIHNPGLQYPLSIALEGDLFTVRRPDWIPVMGEFSC